MLVLALLILSPEEGQRNGRHDSRTVSRDGGSGRLLYGRSCIASSRSSSRDSHSGGAWLFGRMQRLLLLLLLLAGLTTLLGRHDGVAFVGGMSS